ncbi:hypothetical protein SAMN06297280_0022 [Arsukibacterium tuosuense]|uniref:Uncharacterized protein n=1 Tax=Arsukibacterium tuosuense TaxID=1323745 RepID=A0A285JLD8_9GAMM|nr:hypothetical protein [Arsukibacterium tuosuense]SNY60156.1 hypothetical protein SAMN06297280_0022 [Arsukibacterium tuosuense]
MSSPAYTVYNRTVKFSLLIILLLSFFAAFIQFLLQFSTSVKSNQQQLEMFSQQMDAQLTPVLQFAEAVKNRAQLAVQLTAPAEDKIPVLSLTTGDLILHQLAGDSEPLNQELQMLMQLQPYFDIAPASITSLKDLYYVSEQGYAYNGQHKWSDYVVEQLMEWLQRNQRSENGYDRNPVFYKDFILEQAAMSVPFYVNERKTGRFVLALELAPLLESLEKNNPDRYFLLLDQAGNVVASSEFINGDNLEQYQLQIQRLAGLPWSIALIDKRRSLFSAGLGSFILHWLSYAAVLLLLAWLLAKRYKRKIMGPLQRLSIHIDRLANEQAGVRRIPDGWQDLFERVSQLRASDSQKTD